MLEKHRMFLGRSRQFVNKFRKDEGTVNGVLRSQCLVLLLPESRETRGGGAARGDRNGGRAGVPHVVQGDLGGLTCTARAVGVTQK